MSDLPNRAVVNNFFLIILVTLPVFGRVMALFCIEIKTTPL